MFALENLERFSSNRLRIARLQRIKLLLRVLALVAAESPIHNIGGLNSFFTGLFA